MPGYNTANNRYTLAGTSYDADGDLLNDTFHTYTWLADGHVATVGTGSTLTTVTYDAMGNKVEENIGGVVHEYVSAFGVSAQMTGQTENATTVGLPGGVEALYAGGSLQRYRFPDWQGTIRAESNPSTRAFTESLAFAPFGERYAQLGSAYNVDSFTGQPDQITGDEYDFTAREMHDGQGRWVSPDPLPGPGNKYAYAGNNPLSNVDLGGLEVFQINLVHWADSQGVLLPGLSPMDGEDGNENLGDYSQNVAPAGGSTGESGGADGQESGAAQQQGQATPPAGDAVPTNFQLSTGGFDPGSYTLRVQLTWSSSSGNMDDIAECRVGEIVLYPGTGREYIWPSPMQQTTSNPFAPTPSPGNQMISDSHGGPKAFTKPYMGANFDATQKYTWACPNGKSGVGLGPITITRSVSQNAAGAWTYSINLSTGQSGSAQLP